MSLTRMATLADRRAMAVKRAMSRGKSDIVKKFAADNNLPVIEIKLSFSDQERYDMGYDDATCNRDHRELGPAYNRGWIEGRIKCVEWAIDDLNKAYGLLVK